MRHEQNRFETLRRLSAPLPTQPLCVQCHGPSDRLPDDVQAKLRALYPSDRAVGYLPGEVRGGLFPKKSL